MITVQSPFRYLLKLLIVLHLFTSSSGFSQGITTESATSQTSSTANGLAAEISNSLQRVEEQKAASPDATAPATAAEILGQAKEQLQLRDQFSSRTRENEEAVREAPAMLERVRQGLEQSDTQTTAVDLPSTATVDYLAQRLEEQKAELQSLEQRQIEVDEEISRRSTRSTEIPVELTEARRQLSQAEIAANATSPEDDPLVAQARLLLAQAQIQAANARIAALEKEQARYEARAELLPLASQLLAQRVGQKSEQIAALTERLNAERRQEATATAREMQQVARDTGTSHAVVQMVASENTSYTEELALAGIIEKHEKMQERLASVQEEAKVIQQQYTSLKEKFDQVGYSDALGILLRKQRNELPNRRAHLEMLESLETTLLEVNLKSLELQDLLNEMQDPSAEAQELIDVHAATIPTTQTQEVRRDLTTLLQARKEYLVKVDQTYEEYFQTLYSLNAAEQELVESSRQYAEFIDERIFWLPSADLVSLSSISLAWDKFVYLVSPSTWIAYVDHLTGRARIGIAVIVATVALFLFLLFMRFRWKRQLNEILKAAGKNRLNAFRPVMRAIGYAGLIALPVPLLMIVGGLPLSNTYDEIAALANGFIRGGLVLFLVLFAKNIIRRNGIAEVFFVWPESALLKLRHAFNVLVWIYVPAVILVRASQVDGSDGSMEIARIVLAFALSVVALLSARLLHPKKGVLTGLEVYRQSGWLYRLRYVTFVVVPVVFAGLAIGALIGYVYTAIEISQRINISFWLGAALILVNEVVFFWILVKRRRLAIEEARRRREAAKAQEATVSETGNAEQLTAAEPAIDIAAISRQAGRLLHVAILGIFLVGLWVAWADVLPALRYLDTQPLWSTSRTITEAVGEGTTQTVNKLVPVTVADLLLAVFICFVAVVAIRNIPGLLDITVFQKFQVQSGERYAFNTLIRYVLIILGVIAVANLMGLQWKQIQWLVAAVSVGLGFGLQEIFANFVSGLILLFERPVRVGDFVSVGGIKGNITEIRIRATTVRDWDHFEHIIPNKEMITKPVENWTLSDLKRRLMIHVGVPYGCDYDLARDILVKVAEENPYVLKDPGPAAGIESLADSAVVLVVFAHLPNSDDYLIARHTLIAEFARRLEAAGISIPFPQMDVHIDRI